jgi:hypothetical protein
MSLAANLRWVLAVCVNVGYFVPLFAWPKGKSNLRRRDWMSRRATLGLFPDCLGGVGNDWPWLPCGHPLNTLFRTAVRMIRRGRAFSKMK